MTKLTIEDIQELSHYKNPELFRRFLGDGISIEEIFSKPTPKYYHSYYHKLSFRVALLIEFAEKDKEIMGKIVPFLHNYILYEIQEQKNSFPHSPEYNKKCNIELQELNTYFLGQNMVDLHTFYSQVSKAMNIYTTHFWSLYYMIAAYNYCYRHLHEIKSPFQYFNLKGFVNKVAKSEHFFSELAKHFGAGQVVDIRYEHIY